MERVINKNYRNLFRNLIVGINEYKLPILREYNVLNINPTLRNSKYAFLFLFSLFTYTNIIKKKHNGLTDCLKKKHNFSECRMFLSNAYDVYTKISHQRKGKKSDPEPSMTKSPYHQKMKNQEVMQRRHQIFYNCVSVV